MKKSGFTFGFLCVVLFELALIACAVLAFIKGIWALGALACVVFLAVLWLLAGFMRLKTLLAAFESDMKNRNFEEAEKVAQTIKNSKLFYPVMRFMGLRVMLQVSMAKDELGEAKKYIDRIRHGGGAGWKYQTAYCAVLIALDEGSVDEARAEYEDFRLHNQGVELYQEQLEVLDALFERLFTRNDTPLPESVGKSLYPVVQRILGKHFEERAAASAAEWN